MTMHSSQGILYNTI